MAQNPICIEVGELKSKKGNVVLSIYTSEENFQDNIAFSRYQFSKEHLNGTTLKTCISLPEGEYGIAFLDDLNKDGDLNYNLIGIPKEGYGFSGYYHRGMKRPKFEDFSFSHKDSTHLQIRLRYF